MKTGDLLIICGPTATGKTGLGVGLAKKFNGEIVSADSRQVYQGMDIGTGKDINKQISKFQISKSISNKTNHKFQIGFYKLDNVRVWLLDVVRPDYQFSVADYLVCAQAVVEDIWRRGKLPIVVGGTGFYIKALIKGVETVGVKPDWKLREKLSNLEIEKLRNELRRLDFEKLQKMNESDRQNPRRLIRGIEIAKKMQNAKCKMQNDNFKLKASQSLMIGLRADNQYLYQRIDQRVEKRIEQGIEGEIEKLLKQGYGWKNSALGNTLGYRQWEEYFKGSKAKEEIIQKWKFAEHGYARRQMTWFKKQFGIKWFDISQKNWQLEVERLASRWYNKNNAKKG
ncbi:tRNA (adenosine(37)-N6)-dimethylallyltransferase MiaA [Patescibacteria group bacterium]